MIDEQRVEDRDRQWSGRMQSFEERHAVPALRTGINYLADGLGSMIINAQCVAILQTLTEDVLKSSEIEGEIPG
jgi:hypothetical protein